MKIFRTPIYFRWIFPRRKWGFSASKNCVYLTFDDGPTPKLSPWILDLLKQEKIPATFFCVGANAEAHPELVQRTLAEGHSIGNHTMRHEKGTKVSKNAYLASIDEASHFIPSKLFRPPYGRLPMIYGRNIRKKYTIVMWTWLSYDYDPSVSVSEILARAQRIKAGDILVLHDNEKVAERLQELLPKLIVCIREKGLKFAAISA